MELRIISHNVKGLNNLATTQKLWLYYKDQFPSLDILLLQEHKLRGEKAKCLGSQLCRNSKSWFTEATLGYSNIDDGASKGGVYILVSEKMCTKVVEDGQLGDNQVQWIRLHGLPSSDLGIANVYTPNDPKDQCFLWVEMIRNLPQNCKWILGGDWNVVEMGKEQSSAYGKLINQVEWFCFRIIESSFQCYRQLRLEKETKVLMG
jgi:exonuclease III